MKIIMKIANDKPYYGLSFAILSIVTIDKIYLPNISGDYHDDD